MKLSQTERLILANQYSILSLLSKDQEDAAYYDRAREAVERGWELAYDWYSNVSDDDAVMPSDNCKEVIDILDMHRMLKRSYESLTDKSDIDPDSVHFRGFDGNEESQFGFMKFLQREGKWAELFDERNDDGNSHHPMLNSYQAMLAAWNESDDRYRLTSDDIKRITVARDRT